MFLASLEKNMFRPWPVPLVRPHQWSSNNFAKEMTLIYLNVSIGLEYSAVDGREGLARLMKTM
jgi:hypothetical protein